jgi:molecular chaperone HtpG
MPEMQFDFDGLIQLLAHHLYSEKKVFIRELIQNAHDSIQRRKAVDDSGYGGRIDIDSRPTDLQIIFRDNGIGMNRHDLEEYLSSIGRSGTREEARSVKGLIGQFGIGFLSAFVVARRVEVRTRKLNEEKGWLWTNEGSKDYQLTPCDMPDSGTTVTVFLKGEEERGVIHEDEVQQVIRRYADMLLVPIHFNGSDGPVNTMHMPWEKDGRSDKELELDCLIYLEKTMRDSVLEAIPVQLSGHVNAGGVLYITRTRTLQIQAPRTIRIFQNRMFLCENVPEILPRWAIFINGVINTSDLTPTAARDNFIRDDAAKALTEELGALVVQHLEMVQKDKPARFSDILRYHNLGIKAACFYYDEFFAKFAHLLEWRTNSGEKDELTGELKTVWRTLPDVISRLPKVEGEIQLLPCFSTSNSANQYFQMANAAGSIVVDASFTFEDQLIEEYTKLKDVNVRLVRVDREDDPNVFRHLTEGQDTSVVRLAEFMTQIIRPGGISRIKVEARRFEPSELAAVIRSSERSTAQRKAESLLNDPNTSNDLREMAQEMVRMARGASIKLTINASNPLIRRLSLLPEFDDKDVINIMLGIYNNAFLYSQELMTPENASILHKQFEELMTRSLDYIEEKAEISKERERLALERESAKSKLGPPIHHRIFFLMTPFDETYGPLVTALRVVVEDQWNCQLFVASDRQYEDLILDNVHRHMEQADAFIAEITTANPNVMFELGAARFEQRGRPVILLKASNSIPTAKLPADLNGLIYIDYSNNNDERLADYLREEMYRNQTLKSLLDHTNKEHYVSWRELKRLSGLTHLPDATFQRLAERFPTKQVWKKTTESDLRPLLQREGDLSNVFLTRIRENL